MKRYSKILAVFTVMSLCVITACGENNKETHDAALASVISETEISASYADAADFFSAVSEEASPESQNVYQDTIVGTWTNQNFVYQELERWATVYETSFSADGQAAHYGNRNMDTGTWERVDENTVIAYFDDCIYTAVGGSQYELPPYQVTYTYDENEKTLSRSTDRMDRLTYESGGVSYEASDFDTYEDALYRCSDEHTISEYLPYPEETEYCTALEKRLLALADELQSGKEVELEQVDLPYQLLNVSACDITGDGKPELFAYVKMCGSFFDNSGALYILSPKADGEYTVLSKNTDFRSGYTDILAPDGTELLVISGYNSASSWKGGVRIHLGYRDNQIVVDREESYGFHWDYPVINYVNDYENGKFYVYVSRETDTGGAGYGSYVSIEQSLKIAEETFAPLYIPFTGYGSCETGYLAIYFLCSPFDEDWWQDGGSYPEDEEAYGRRADWAITAADDNPDEMLREAVEKSGLKLEKKAYPWTPETKKNVADLLRCPVADYYYRSDYDMAAYIRGEIRFYEKEILPDGYEERWVVTAYE